MITIVTIICWVYLLTIVGNWAVFYLLLEYRYRVTRGDAFWMVILSLIPVIGLVRFIIQLVELMDKSTFFSTPIGKRNEHGE